MMTDGLETVAFLAGSENRVRVLMALAERPLSRTDLQSATEVTRATLARVLSDLEDRGWVRREGQQYEATRAGRALADSFRSTTETAAALETLGDLARWFPFDDVAFEVRHLHDARVVRPTKADAIRPVTRSLELIGEAERIRILGSQHAPPALAAFRERIETGELRIDLVVTCEAFETLRAAEHDTDHLRYLVGHDRASVAVTDTDLDGNYAANDDTIVLTVADDNGAPQAIVESEALAVREWFDDRFETVRAEATPVDASDLDG
jgi:predicted transcriptional regulator